MVDLSREILAEVLVRHGYKVINMDSGWTSFALQLRQTELLDEIARQKRMGGGQEHIG